jgi:hypothetical protein
LLAANKVLVVLTLTAWKSLVSGLFVNAKKDLFLENLRKMVVSQELSQSLTHVSLALVESTQTALLLIMVKTANVSLDMLGTRSKGASHLKHPRTLATPHLVGKMPIVRSKIAKQFALARQVW